MSRFVHLALVAAGAALLVGLVRAIGIETLTTQLRGFGFAFFGVLALELLLDGCNTLAWRRTLPPGAAPVGFWRLFWIRQAGTAVNQLTPSATLGGEAVKAMLLRSRVGSGDAVASVVAAKLSFALAQVTLVVLGLAVVLGRLGDAPAVRRVLLLACGTSCAAVGGFLILQRRGLLAPALDIFARLGLRPAWLPRLRARAADLDRRLATLHRRHPWAFVGSVGWHFVAQLVGTLQLFYVLRALSAPATLMTCVAIEAFALVVDSVVFFVPARVGVQEGGRVLVFTTLGLGATTGLAVAVIVRITQLAVAGLGLGALGYLSVTNAPATGSITES